MTGITQSNQYSTLIELLNARAHCQPHDIAFIFLQDGDGDELRITYAELHRSAVTIAAYLQTITRFGDRALLIYPSGLEFICAFLGCIYAGILPVPVQAPRVSRGFAALQAIIHNAEPTTILTDSNLAIFVKNNLSLYTVIATDTLAEAYYDQWMPPVVSEKHIAFLQYTSGSTGLPKGVMVSHENILHNQSMIKAAFQHDQHSIIVGWLPFYHDMGLIGNMLQPIYIGRPCIFMQPMAFLQNPFLWLQAVSRYRATTSGGPSFAYELCLKKITSEQRDTLDLQSWTTAFNGAEPVKGEVLVRFSDYFSACNFKQSAFLPCYGMAEATLFITGGGKVARPVMQDFEQKSLEENKVLLHTANASQMGITVVGCGQITPEQHVAIVSPHTFEECSNQEIGEIWVSGASIAQGYWNNPAATEETFRAQLQVSDQRQYLRTGDLGFIYEKELFIVGRLKDLIIIRGRNYYPQDIEQQVETSHFSLKPNCGAAFSVDIEGEEQLIIVHEIERSHIRTLNVKAVLSAIRKSVTNYFDLTIHTILLLKTGQIPKTSSGKVKRRQCKLNFLNHSFQIVGSSFDQYDSNISSSDILDLAETMQGQFMRCLSTILKIKPSDMDMTQSLNSSGIDSLLAVDLKNHLKQQMGVDWPLVRFLQDETIEQLAICAEAECKSNVTSMDAKDEILNLNESSLSSSQQAMYFLYKLVPDSAAYHVFFAVTIQQSIDQELWGLAWKHLIERHPVLRTTYHVQGGKTIQKVHQDVTVPIQWEHQVTYDKRDLEEKIQGDIAQPFALDKELPIKLRLYATDQGDTVFLFVAHHISCDLESILILMREFGVIYQDLKVRRTITLPNLALTYTEYSYRHIQALQTAEMQRQEHYWKTQLAGPLPTLNLMTDAQRQPIQTFNGATISFKIDNELLHSLQPLAKNNAVTLYVLLVAIFQVLLHRYTGQDDIIIGSPVSGRNDPELQSVVGCFINTIALRLRLDAELPFVSFLNQVRKTVLEAFDHQDYPFHKLVELVHLERDMSRSPIFQAMLILQNARQLEDAAPFFMNEENAFLNLNGLVLQSFPVMKQTALHDLILLLVETKEGLSCSFEYNADLFEIGTIENLSRSFTTLIQELVAEPTRKIRRLLVADFPAVNMEVLTCHDNFLNDFAMYAAKHPEKLAIQTDTHCLTYQSLHKYSNQLAQYLQNQGVVEEILVGILLDRSVEMVVALLAILKAGGAYLPLDPSYPKERLEFMIKDSKLELLISHRDLSNHLQCDALRIIDLDQDFEEIQKNSTETPDCKVLPSSLAYVLYTSGSTGQPKGVMIQRDGLNHFLTSMLTAITFDENDILLAVTTISFDIAVLELFLPLKVGAQIILTNSKSFNNVDSLIDMLNRHEVSVMQATPATWQMLLTRPWQCKPGFKALVGGEIMPPIVAEKLLKKNCSIWNLYGPTENTVWSSVYAVTDIKKDGFGYLKPIPIGKPIASVEAYILDPTYQATMPGIPGELYLGGAGLARGYLNRPDLTQTKFIPHPYSSTPTTRIYATGDLARYLPDGNIEFLGRIDSQIKLRGYRIELSEIENVLLKHDAVLECAVILQPTSAVHDQCLVAYVVTKLPVDGADLYQFLIHFLPAYMVPTLFESLLSLPKTQNNKIDRIALTHMPRPRLSKNAVLASTETEMLLSDIWCDVLKIPQVGVLDNFFHLGGHSMLALKVSNILLEKHAMGVPLHLLFEHPTITSLAAEIDQQQKNKLHRNTSMTTLLENIKNLSPEEVRRLLDTKKSSYTNE